MERRRRELVDELGAVFADVPRPTNAELLHPRCSDDGDIQALYPFARWQDVPDAVVEREYAALAFLSAPGFRHFLPAYLRFVLTHDDEGQAVIGSTFAALDPDRYEVDLAAFQRSKYVLFQDRERHVIGAFTRLFADHEEIGGAVGSWPDGR
ncbi:MAG TPA: DUF6714 family protein [Actinomycetota bacterium]|nr:DUF6714 family protein [Actinomycetota bacterium]